MSTVDSGWSVVRDRRVVRVVFRGHLTSSDGAASATRCRELYGNDSLHLVCDSPDFESYDASARQAWQNTLWPIRSQIKSLTLFNRKPLVRMGVTAFGLFLGIPVATVDSEEKLRAVLASVTTS